MSDAEPRRLEDWTLDVVWRTYRRQAIPPDAPAFQVEAMQNAFVAGAWFCFSLVDRLQSEMPERRAAIIEARLAETEQAALRLSPAAGRAAN